MKGNNSETADFLKKASHAWGMYGDTNKCAESLIKAAKEVFNFTCNVCQFTYLIAVNGCS